MGNVVGLNHWPYSCYCSYGDNCKSCRPVWQQEYSCRQISPWYFKRALCPGVEARSGNDLMGVDNITYRRIYTSGTGLSFTLTLYFPNTCTGSGFPAALRKFWQELIHVSYTLINYKFMVRWNSPCYNHLHVWVLLLMASFI